MRVLGISALSHDAAVAVVEDDRILYAAHSERFSRTKNDAFLNAELLREALVYGQPDLIAWYERPFLKKSRHLLAGQYREAFSFADLPGRYLRQWGLDRIPLRYVSHHESHAAAGFYTSPFSNAVVIVADAIGEWSTFSIGEFQDNRIRWWSESIYPHSLGLLYSAFTQRIGLKPNEEEYILMGMAAYGEPRYKDDIYRDFFRKIDFAEGLEFTTNVHAGIGLWKEGARREDLAASIQAVNDEVMLDAARWAAGKRTSDHLILMGGVALNCVSNEKVARLWEQITGSRDNLWIMPNPGDAGSALGAAAAIQKRPLRWEGPYLGTDVPPQCTPQSLSAYLQDGHVAALCQGRAEYGPRALGNRSILADPRGARTKEKVNEFKRRDQFRPFAPVILEEYADAYFDMPVKRSPYMQFTAPCRYPEEFPAICHVDGSSRVQTVNQTQSPFLYELIKDFHASTGCPMLLNTSMNLKGEPLVNTRADAERFSRATGVRLF